MHVQQVELVDLGDFRHARGQRQVVWRVLEQRIARDFHLVIVDVLLRLGQTDGLRVRDEVHLVTALGQLETEFGRDHAAAAVRGITGDSDLHDEWISVAFAKTSVPRQRIRVEQRFSAAFSSRL